MHIKKYWPNYIGATDDSLNLVAFLEDQDQDEISLSEIFAKIGLDKQNWDFHQTVGYLEFTHSDGGEMDFHFAIDLVTDLAAILLECIVSGGVELRDLDEYCDSSRRVRVTATPEEHAAMNRALSDFVRDPLSYDLHELVPDEDMFAMAEVCENIRQELYDSGACSLQSTMPGGEEPSELAQAMMEYLDCESTYFPSMRDDAPIMSAYRYARRLGVREGFIPLLVKVDETLWECFVTNTDPENDGADGYAFNPKKVAEYREKMLAATVQDGKAVLEELISQRKEDIEDDDMDWEEVLGEMDGGYENHRFSSYWDSDADMTVPLILAKIPVKNPWEIFAYLPFGNWNECPDTPELMAAAKYWFERYGAVPAAMTHDELEFDLPAPVSGNEAMEVAVEQYGICPDMDQNFEEMGALADTLRQSTVWYFWWD